MLTKLAIILLVLIPSSFICAQDKPTIPAFQVEQPPVIDGDLADPCWQQAPSVQEFFFLPDGSKALEPTTARICYDSRNIYVAFHCNDADPKSIIRQQKKRGGSLDADDYVGIELACYQDRTPIVWFDVSAGGIQVESLQSGDVSKIEWRGDWHAATKLTADGYDAEMAIPFSILQYDPNAKRMNVAFIRKHARSDHTWWAPDVGPTGSGEPRNFYVWEGLSLPTPKYQPLIMGYTLAGIGDGGSSGRAGLDIKHAVTPTITAALTTNPDFRNVEQSVNNVDFTYTEQYLPDSRPFFQEGSGYFPGSDVFYTRRIEEIDLGTKAYGRYGDCRLGALHARRFGETGYSVVALNRDWPGRGALNLRAVQSRAGDEDNFVGNASASYYLLNREDHKISVDGELITSALTGAGQSRSYDFGIDSWGGPRTLEWSINHEHIDPDFAPILGYVPESDISKWHFWTQYEDQFSTGDVNHWNTSLYADFADHTDGSLYYNTVGWSGHVHWTNTAAYVDLTSSKRRELIEEGEGIPAHLETFSDKYVRLRYRWNNNDLYKLTEAQLAFGKRGGGDYLYYSLQTGYLLTDKLSVRMSYGFGRVREPSPLPYLRRQLVTTLTYDIDNERTLGGRLVAEDGRTNTYLAYKQRVRRGMDVYVIYGDPNAESTRNSLMVKLLRPI